MNILFDQLLSVSAIRWQRILEDFHTMSSFMRKMVLMVSDGLTKEKCIAGYLVAKKIHRLVKGGGLLATALYLKQCNACLMQAYGGDKRPHAALPIFVSLTRSGYPTIIPSFHRKKMRRKDSEADDLVQLYLSFFSLSRIVELAPKVTAKTFVSIDTPPRDPATVGGFVEEVRQAFDSLTERYIPWVSELPLTQGVSWIPTWKSLPSHPWMLDCINSTRKEQKKRPLRKFRSCFPAFSLELCAFSYYATFCKEQSSVKFPGALWQQFVRYARDPMSEQCTEVTLDYFDRAVYPYLPATEQWDASLFMGRLGQSLKDGAKRRIFAIGNYVNQRLLHPVHDWAMSILRKIPMDGTFNQTKPFDILAGQMIVYSYDLKSATDRWPLPYIYRVFEHLFDPKFAQSVIHNTLGYNIFKVPFVKREDSVVAFMTGQPLGYLSSWPLFALTHHYLVWWAADQVHPGAYFHQYAILGDDIVITDEEVAIKYKWAVNLLGVDISDQKSLISHQGCGEFAKRFRVKGMTKDLSPRSAKALKAFNHPYGLLGLHLKYNFKRFTTLLRVGGSGYRVLANYSKSKSKFVRRLHLLFTKTQSLSLFKNLEWWFGQGQPLNPYLKGLMVSYMLNVLKPKDLTVAPDDIYMYPYDVDMCEYTVRRGWMTQWLRYVTWYWLIRMNLNVSLDHLFEAPEVTSHYKAKRTDPTLVKFGHIWKLWDLVSKVGLNPNVPILGENTGPFHGVWLIGGKPNTQFMVSAEGVCQPSVGNGWCYSNATPSIRIIRYKTLSVADRTVSLGYCGPSNVRSNTP